MQYVERGGDAVRNAFAKYTYTLVGQDGSVNLTARFVHLPYSSPLMRI